MSKKIIWGISSKHLFVYGITLLISIGLIFGVYIQDKNWSTICVSIGTGGLTSALVGYFIDLANSIENHQTRKRNIVYVIWNYKRCLTKLLCNFFRIMTEVYDEKDPQRLYKSSIRKILENLETKVESYDKSQYTIKTTNNCIEVNPSMLDKHDTAIKLMKLTNNSLKALFKTIKEITSQNKIGLLKYYTEDEIDKLNLIANSILEYETGEIYDYYQILKDLLDKQFYQILGFKDVENLIVYFENKKCAIYEKEIVFSQFSTLKNFGKSKSIEFFD